MASTVTCSSRSARPRSSSAASAPRPAAPATPGRRGSPGLTLLADRVRLDLEGQPPALVDVTPAAVAELSLTPGSQVWLTVKATDLEVYTRDHGQQG